MGPYRLWQPEEEGGARRRETLRARQRTRSGTGGSEIGGSIDIAQLIRQRHPRAAQAGDAVGKRVFG